MCGIAGYYCNKDRPGEDILRNMTESLSHRGPDATGYFSEGPVGFGHQRLKIIDLSDAANQPMVSANGRYVMIFNGEVYNFKSIAAELKLQPKTHSDTEVVLEAFSSAGIRSFGMFNGMYALMIYDKQERKLTIARDRIGIKPLYYYQNSDNYFFASELKAIRKAPVDLVINQNTISGFLQLGYIPGPDTIYQNVSKFPAGHYMEITDDGMEVKPYWELTERIKPDPVNDEATAKKELADRIRKSVEYRMISDVPFGTFLSGGIDSSLVTAMAQSLSSKPVNTFSIGFKESDYNEAPYAKKVADYLGTSHHTFMVSHQEAIDLFDEIIQTYDEPFADSSGIPTMLVSKLARQHVTMTLSGDGGDELFYGYGSYKWAARLSYPGLKMFRKPISAIMGQLNDRYKRVGKLIDYPSTESLKRHIFSQEQYFFSSLEIDKLVIPKMEWVIMENFNTGRELSPVEEQALFDLHYYLKDDLLVKVDRASMKYGLETRVPLLDHEIVEFALNLSENLKLKNGEPKYLLKQVLYDLVPARYFDRPKWGFSIPLRHWLKNELRDWMEIYTGKEMVEGAGLVNYSVVNDLKKKYLNGQDHLFNRLWLIIVLHKWLSDYK